MDITLPKIGKGSDENYVIPFLWVDDQSDKIVLEQIEKIHSCGIRAFCLESRTFSRFCKEEWWELMRKILVAARNKNMRVWVLDDKHFPTGYANGGIDETSPFRKWHLCEQHVDIMGTGEQLALRVSPYTPEDELIGAVLCKRPGKCELDIQRGTYIPGGLQDGFFRLFVPDGCHRVFFLWKTRAGCLRGQENYIHLIDDESVDVLIREVYEPHYHHLGEFFGKELAGFFSDEPCMGNDMIGFGMPTKGFYDKTVGTPGMALPWRDDMLNRLSGALGGDVLTRLPSLWYRMEDDAQEVRVAYMDIVTRLYQDCFSKKLGDWCRGHHVEYIGHVIEDMGAHARLGYGPGHYFRALAGQDMAGVDIVLHQVMPGFGDHDHAAFCAGGVADSSFFHFLLAKLGSSLAHIMPHMKNRAFCEVFGAYGWAEGLPMMKWLIDHLLVRGITYFVPHAFSPSFPNPDCPPHFDAGGQNPQFEDFARLMRYSNAMGHLLSGGMIANPVAVLYHAEAQWSGRPFMPTQDIARELAEHQLDFDVLPIDALLEARLEGGLLRVANVIYPCLIIPYAQVLPRKVLQKLQTLGERGFPILYVQSAPIGIVQAEVVMQDRLAQRLLDIISPDIRLAEPCPYLRTYHLVRDGNHIWMFFNESTMDSISVTAKLSTSGLYRQIDWLLDSIQAGEAAEGKYHISLSPYQSTVLVFDAVAKVKSAMPSCTLTLSPVHIAYQVSYALCESPDAYIPIVLGGLEDISVHLPQFAGRIRYEGTFWATSVHLIRFLDLGRVGETVSVWLNGKELGSRICPPYRYDVHDLVLEGENKLVITVSSNLSRRIFDPFSAKIPLSPVGLLGPVTMLKEKECSFS